MISEHENWLEKRRARWGVESPTRGVTTLRSTNRQTQASTQSAPTVPRAFHHDKVHAHHQQSSAPVLRVPEWLRRGCYQVIHVCIFTLLCFVLFCSPSATTDLLFGTLELLVYSMRPCVATFKSDLASLGEWLGNVF